MSSALPVCVAKIRSFSSLFFHLFIGGRCAPVQRRFRDRARHDSCCSRLYIIQNQKILFARFSWSKTYGEKISLFLRSAPFAVASHTLYDTFGAPPGALGCHTFLLGLPNQLQNGMEEYPVI